MAAPENCFTPALRPGGAIFGCRAGFADTDATETPATAGLDVQMLTEISRATARK